MTDKLPPNLLALFAARPPLRWVEPSDHAPEKRRTAPIGGLAAFLPELQKYKETDVYQPTESWLEMRDRKKREQKEAAAALVTEGPKQFKPNEDPNIRGDAFKTLIVARLSYDADERDLEREFGRFGPIERIRIIVDTHAHEKPNKKKKPHRGYAFVVFEREKDMREQCPLVLVALEALEALEEEAAAAAAASVEASREDSRVAEVAEAVSVEALAVAVEVSEEEVTLAPEEVTETAALEPPTEPHPDLEDSTDEMEVTGASPVVGLSLVADAHTMIDLAVTEMAAVDMVIVIVATAVTVIENVVTEEETEEETETAKDVALAATWNPLAAEKVGIVTGTGTTTALAMMTAGNEDTKAVATKILGNCVATSVATKAGARASRLNFRHLVGKLIVLTSFLRILSFTSQG
ncbi:uncharacterized protein Triagg1_10660 [Trichoderma aggressivum f. europaeum]|uniref:RRM domain-containing protein n=1 Tax=Trichoderma aggressivum f. europaeum TaxID=173218 RepID=A0AAE1I548_9HYPO|nr:hypothetical protein Triagg1_10660 [Trichoderma aggressivum f. europaeum]